MTESSPFPGPLSLRVAGSTSNLGPGFDFLGLALDLWLDVAVTGTASGDRHELVAVGGSARTWPSSDDNVLTRALDFALRQCGAPPMALRIEAHSEIPIGRGFGSSGAATAAGLLLGHALAGHEATEATLVSHGALLEGHPDNTTASLLGGCTLAIPTPVEEQPEGAVRWRVVRQSLHATIGIAIAWPESPLPTPEARRALPDKVSFADAVENPRRAAALLEGLRTGDPELLALGGEDRLHVAYRLPLIPGAARALEAARTAGAWLATISGSGSGLIALGAISDCDALARAMARELETGGTAATARVVTPSAAKPGVIRP